jgi:hypothetical protein
LSVGCNEYSAWQDDKHQGAHRILSEKPAQEMAARLSIANAATAKACIVCHGAYVDKPEQVAVKPNLEEGVSCLVCHGSNGDWIDVHAIRTNLIPDRKNQEWRAKTADQRATLHGMINVWDPVQRAELCASCHIGNYKQDKVVTHAMYVAGHPPLPSIEIATFSNEMPRHWELLKEKRGRIQRDFKRLEDPSQQIPPDQLRQKSNELMMTIMRARVPGSPSIKNKELLESEYRYEETKAVLVGGMVAFRESAELLGGASREATWPEFAQFDCYACHHELQRPSWRQEQTNAGKPGRPEMRAWPTVLARLALHALGDGEGELNLQLRSLRRACDSQPFGNPAEIQVATDQAVAWATKKCDDLNRIVIRDADIPRLLRFLVGLSKENLDYDSARQVAWACQVVNENLPPEQRNAVIGHMKSLELDLPAGREVSIMSTLDKNLRIRNAFQPAAFASEMEQVFEQSKNRFEAAPRP